MEQPPDYFRSKGSRHQATKSCNGCNGRDETWCWDLLRSISEGLRSLQKMDQRMIGQKIFYGSFEL